MRDVSEILQPGRSFPDMVFRTEFKYFFATDFSWLLTNQFYEDFRKLLRAYHETADFIVLDPEERFYRDSEIPSNFHINVNNIDIYPQALGGRGQDDLVDWPYYTAETVFLRPSDGLWAIYGERSYEVIIFATKTAEVFTKLKEIFENYVYNSDEDDYGEVINGLVSLYSS